MNRSLNFFLHSNIFISFCVVSLAFSTQFMLNSFNFEILFLLFFATFISYNFQRIVFHTKLNKSQLSSWYNSYKKVIYFLLGFSLLMFVYFFLKLKLRTQLIVFFISLISFLYPFGLRDIPFLKIFLISFSWSVSTVSLIYFENNLLIDHEFYLEILSRFFFIIGITIPFDIRDLQYDNKSLKTIPIVFGASHSRNISLLFLVLYILTTFYLHFYSQFNLNYLLAAFFCFIYSFYLVNNANVKMGSFYYSFWLESCSFSLLIFLIITSLFL